MLILFPLGGECQAALSCFGDRAFAGMANSHQGKATFLGSDKRGIDLQTEFHPHSSKGG
jgi:hypothetical protein